MNLVTAVARPRTSTAAGPGAENPGHYPVVLTILVSCGVIYTAAQAFMLPTLGVLSRGLHSSPTATTWTLTIFILSGGISTPIIGRLGDMFGKKRALIVMLLTVTLGIVLCALATSLAQVLAGRFLIGTSSGCFPLGFGIIRDEFPRDRVATAVGVMSISVGVGTAAGLLLAGVIAAHLSYHWLFWTQLLLAAPTLVAALLWIPESPVRPGGTIDWIGAGMLVAGLVSILLGISEASTWGWASARTAALVGIGFIILLLWVWFERRQSDPLIDMRTMARPSVWRTNGASALSGVCMFSSFAVIPRFVQEPASTGYGFGASVFESGLYLIPSACAMVVVALLAGRIERRVGSRNGLILGSLAGAAGFLLIGLSPTTRWAIYFGMGLCGVGVGVAYAGLPNLIIQAVPQNQTGAATAINTIVRSVGGAIGVQVCTTIIAQDVVRGLPGLGGYTGAFWICGAALFGAALTALLIPPRMATGGVKPMITPVTPGGAPDAG